MTMAADLFLALGAAVVKAALRLWAGDTAAAGDSLIDLLAGSAGGDLDRRQLRRLFEDIELPAAARMRAVRDTEFRGLADNEWQAAVLAAAGAFDAARLSAADLVRRDLDPQLIKRQVIAAAPHAARDLSADAAELYSQLLSEGSAQIIEIADKLPRFGVAVAAELLRRTSQILADLTRALAAIPVGQGGTSREAQFVTDCRRNIATRFDRLELLGVDSEQAWYPLDIAYVSLQATRGSDSGQAIEDRLAAESRLLLLGRAGSGKTTVLQWLAIRAARGDFAEPLSELSGRFPFFIRLRDYMGRQLPGPEDFLATTAPTLASAAPPGWALDQMRSGQALVLVDGIDELPAGQRDKVAAWLRELIDLYPGARYVVTGRPTAVSPRWLAELGFARSSLEAMPPELVGVFVRRWHEAARRHAADDADRDRLAAYEQALLLGVQRDRYVRDLADSPLLAGLLCALNRNLRAHLPRRRCEIYERALVMFDQRDRARGITAGDLDLDLTAKTLILARLALWMVRNGIAEASTEKAVTQIRNTLAGLPDPPADADAVFRYLLERSIMLREPAAGQVDFVHRTFQEYLAGKAAVDEDAIDELVSRSGNDQWGEVVVLAAGQANQVQAAELIRGLVRRNWRGQQQYDRATMAVACLQEARVIGSGLRREVEAMIPGLLPPRSMDQAEQLTAAGPALVPLLAQHWTSAPDRAAETIRAASLLGGREAMDLIRDVALHKPPDRTDYAADRLGAELTRAWQYFGLHEYARSVLAAGQVTSLQLRGAAQLRALAQVPSLRALAITWSPADAAVLSQAPLPQVSRLSVAGQVSGWAWLAGWAGLTQLTVSKFGHQDLVPLPGLPRLRELTLTAPSLASLDGIAQLPGLTSLTLRRCSELAGLSPLRQLPALVELSLSGIREPGLPALGPGGPQLTSLFLFDCGTVDLAPLSGASGLFVAYSGNTRLRNADVLGPGSSTRPISTGARLRRLLG